MHSPRTVLSIIILLVLAASLPVLTVLGHASARPRPDSAEELLAAVNGLRAERGLPPYRVDPILMSIAQTQAEYLASQQMSNVHIDQYGRLPFQRALDAGYLVAGDLSQRGFFSENVTGGVNLSPAAAVLQWTGDDPHLNTMISPDLQDMGAGVAVDNNTYYYVLDAGRSTGGTPVAYTPPANLNLPTHTLVPNTPQPDGSIIHIVRRGDTLGSISLAYDIAFGDLLALNGLTSSSVIFPDQEILVRPANTATPTQPTGTATGQPTLTPWPTSSPTGSPSPAPATPTPGPGLAVPAAAGAAGILVLVAVILAAGLSLVGRKKS